MSANATTRTLLYNMLPTISSPMDKILPPRNIWTCRHVGLWQCWTAASNRNDGFNHVTGVVIGDAIDVDQYGADRVIHALFF